MCELDIKESSFWIFMTEIDSQHGKKFINQQLIGCNKHWQAIFNQTWRGTKSEDDEEITLNHQPN